MSKILAHHKALGVRPSTLANLEMSPLITSSHMLARGRPLNAKALGHGANALWGQKGIGTRSLKP